MHLSLESPIVDTPRVQQIRGMFDLPAEKVSRVAWNVALPLGDRAWNIGLIVGPSGCGKSTLARALFPEAPAWDAQGLPAGMAEAMSGGSVVDGFPEQMSIRDIALVLSSVGFASPPCWLRPFHVLSTGQKFRVALAWLLARGTQPPAPAASRVESSATSQQTSAEHRLETCATSAIVFDEYTSVVDRTVAQVGSAAAARVIRQRGLRFVAVTCHEDVEQWLGPDWVYRPAENVFAWRRLRRRPAIDLDIVRVKASAWPLFAPHHYLNAGLSRSAVCFLASWRDRPVAFSAWLPFLGGGDRAKREHRTVTLPDFQGVGIGNALSDFVASLWRGQGYRALSTTTHPAMIRARLASPHWRMHRAPSFAGRGERRLRHATTRLTAGFTYVGPPLPGSVGRALVG